MAFVLVIMLVLFVTACAKTEEAQTKKITTDANEEDLASVEKDMADIDSLEDELDFSELDSLDEDLNFDI